MQSLATAVVPVNAAWTAAVEAKLDEFSDWNGAAAQALRDALLPAGGSETPFVHFLSVVVVPALEDERGAHLLIELCADGEPREALRRLAQSIPGPLNGILAAAGERHRSPDALGEFLAGFNLKFGPGLVCRTAGLQFYGTPDLSVKRILDEAKLARRLHELLGSAPAGSAAARLAWVRARIFRDVEYKWAFVSEPIARVAGEAKPVTLLTLVWAAVRDFAWPLAPLPFVMAALSWYYTRDFYAALWHFAGTVLVELVLTGLVAALGYRLLRRDEKEDVPLDLEPAQQDIADIVAREDRRGVVQNHLFAVSRMKPGWWRRATLRFGLWIVGASGAKGSKPGFLDEIGSIHFARWLRLPGTDRLVFLSNYDGSWQSYLEDFIARLRKGLTAIWSNTRDFPRSAYLADHGAEDGARFKRWARRQQRPTRLWFSAYPGLTTARIRTNARIRHGFASAATEQESAAWLSLFGHPPVETLETGEVPALVFGGLSRLPHCHCLVVELPRDPGSARTWLQSIEAEITYGDRSPQDAALVVGFTAGGLRKLGLDEPAIRTFPVAFQEGLSPYGRALRLGDYPATWQWQHWATDAIVLFYDVSPRVLDLRVDLVRDSFRRLGFGPPREIALLALGSKFFEAFGFRDGLSQPIMLGTSRAARDPDPLHTVHPGELVLGYRDNLGLVAPTPQDRGEDIGRNGTYLVVRQLAQDVQAFNDYLADTARALILADDPRAPSRDQATLEHWIAAKMMGRWKDGTSLVRNPLDAGGTRKPPREPDNAFRFGVEDPDGLRCPLGAHVRRSNPRDSLDPGSALQVEISNRHRILRVGRSYVPTAGGLPGQLFMCINADIERQFEFLQQTWILGSGFHGLEGEVDPIAGSRPDGSMLVPTPAGPLHLRRLGAFVTALGGGYFFMPGRSTLARLAR